MKHTRAFWTKKQQQKAQIKRGGELKKSKKLLYLISAIFKVRPHVFINITSDVIQGDAPGIKPPGMSDPPLAIIICDVPAASIHGFKEGHLVMWLMVINLPPPCRKELLYRGWGKVNRVEGRDLPVLGGLQTMLLLLANDGKPHCPR